MHKSGFVNIIGRPNVGKSTLMNTLVGTKMSIITHKPQTTRHRIMGIVNEKDYQVVFSDTPGIVSDPIYKMHENMNRYVWSTFEDADVMIFMTESGEKYDDDDPIIERLKRVKAPLFLVVNKTDKSKQPDVLMWVKWWNDRVDFKETIPISALNKKNTDVLFNLILDNLNEGPAYYPKDQLTDRSERFFVSEIIREKILKLYREEIPYSAEVIIEFFQEPKHKNDVVRISASIFVMRDTQKSIIIGKGGVGIKRLGTEARKDIEKFLDQRVFLELLVKVKENWRNDDNMLKRFGYDK
ncbi:MAG: GTP-binding protein Era [Maribacter sp.]|jgi:GTP-binding protein Era